MHYFVTTPSIGNSVVWWTVDDRVLGNIESSQKLSILFYSIAGSISVLASRRRQKWV